MMKFKASCVLHQQSGYEDLPLSKNIQELSAVCGLDDVPTISGYTSLSTRAESSKQPGSGGTRIAMGQLKP